MRYPREVLDEIRQRISIEEIVGLSVTLQRGSGPGKYKGLCPFHQEDTPSFTVDTHRGLFYCFGCTSGGDVFKFLMMNRGLSFSAAVRELADQCGIQLQELSDAQRQSMRRKANLYDVCKITAAKYASDLLTKPNAQAARDYLRKRGFHDETILNFQIGYADDSFDGLLNYLHRKDISVDMAVRAGLAKYRDVDRPERGAYSLFRDRIIVPIRDYRGRVIAFGGRKMPTADKRVPKYINSPETDIYKKSKVLYALSMARPSIQKNNQAMLVEGYFDVISLHQAGIKEAIAACGTALTADHLESLRTLTSKVIFMFDSDEAGIRAAEKSFPLFVDSHIEAFRLDLGDAKDPDEFLINYGKEKFIESLKNIESLFMLKLRRLILLYGISPGGKQKVIEEMLPFLRKMTSVSRNACIEVMSSHLGVFAQSIQSQIGRATENISRKVASPSRWQASAILRDLIWLLIHYPTVVRQLLETIEPSHISSNKILLYAIGLLMEGHSVADVVENISDDAIRRLLFELSVREQLYQEEDVGGAATQIINRIRLSHLEQSLLLQQQKVASSVPAEDISLYLSELRKLQEIRSEMEALQHAIRSFTKDVAPIGGNANDTGL